MKTQRKTLNLKELTKITKAKVGAGFTTPYIERAIEVFTKEIVKALFEGKRVKLGKLILKAEISETPTIKVVRNPQTGETMEKEYKPFIKFKVLPRKIEFSNTEEKKAVEEEILNTLNLIKR